jgi:hypothetical protein
MATVAKMSRPLGGDAYIGAISEEWRFELSFPPHVKGPRIQCSECRDLVGDPPLIVLGGCHHPVENYHVIEVDSAGIKAAMTLACQEENCDGRGYCSLKD